MNDFEKKTIPPSKFSSSILAPPLGTYNDLLKTNMCTPSTSIKNPSDHARLG